MQKTQEMQVRSLCWEDALKKGMATHSSILAGEFHGYSPWYQKELDTTEQLMLSLFFSVGFSQDFFVIHISYSYRYLFLW